MKTKIAFICTVLTVLVTIGGSHLIAAHHGAGHGNGGHLTTVQQRAKSNAIAACRKKPTPLARMNCIKAVNARYAKIAARN